MEFPCTQAMVSDVKCLTPDQTVEEAIAIFKEYDIRNVPVVDNDGKFVGMFGLQQVMINLLPKSASMEDGLDSLNFVVDAAPGMAKRLRKLHSVPVGELVNQNPPMVAPETSTIESLMVLAKKGSPVAVVDEKTKEFKGTITRSTLLKDLYRILEEIEEIEEE